MQVLLCVLFVGVCILDIMQIREFNRRFVQTELERDKYRDKYNDLRVKYASLRSNKGGR